MWAAQCYESTSTTHPCFCRAAMQAVDTRSLVARQKHDAGEPRHFHVASQPSVSEHGR